MLDPALKTQYQTLLYQLLPGLYRGRDTDGDLQNFVALFGTQFARLRAGMDQLWQDFYIDSCQDWVIPYIADLLGTDILFNAGARNRADVKNTMKWRRQKGTLSGLEDVAFEIGGWGTLAIEALGRLIWSQNLNHIRSDNLQTVDLANGSLVARVPSAFDLAAHTLDLRPPANGIGLYQLSNVVMYEWPIPATPWLGADPAKLDARRYHFHPLGIDQMLSSGGDDKTGACPRKASNPATTPDICTSHADGLFIRSRDFRDNPQSYFGVPSGFSVFEDGILISAAAATVATASTAPCGDYFELAQIGGILVADPGLFGNMQFRVSAVRLACNTIVVNGGTNPVIPSTGNAFANNYHPNGVQGAIATPAFTYTKGLPYNPGSPDYHEPWLLLRIERAGANAGFPECEIIFKNSRGSSLLAFLPTITGMTTAQAFYLYVAADGSTYYARATHDAGDPDRNPDSGFLGAYLPRHLARGASGQARPRPGRPLKFRRAVYRRLCCWDQPLPKPPAVGEVAFDPERGRFAFPAGEEPKGQLTVDFRFGFTGSLGAGPYDRGQLTATTITVAKTQDAPHRTIQDAINASPAGGPQPVIIEIEDSQTYLESIQINKSFPGGLTIQAKALQMPVLQSAGGNVLQVTSPCGNLVLDGLVLSGGGVSITAAVSSCTIRFCSFEPNSWILSMAPTTAHAQLTILNSIIGTLTASNNVDSLTVSDSIVHCVAGQPGLSAPNSASLERVTVIGDSSFGALMASNSIFFGAVTLNNAAASCLRYSRFPNLPAGAPTFNCTSAYPIFASLRFGHPAYAHLTPNTDAALRTGGENGGEMGAFCGADIPFREQNVSLKLNEYLPAGLQVAAVRVLPVARFAGVRKL
jgi:Phage tail protein (Tail_P2_I)